jgi:predicted transcriptional regulator
MYNLHRKHENWLTNLAPEAETAINFLPNTDREYYRKQASKILTQLQRHASNENRKLIHKSNREWKTMKAITAKLKDNNTVVTPADKGNTTVILPSAVCQEKIQNFIDNNFRTSNSDPTKTYQKQIRKTINNSPKLINSNEKWKYVNLNPTPLPSGA